MLRDKSDNVAESTKQIFKRFTPKCHSNHGALWCDCTLSEGFLRDHYYEKFWYGNNNRYAWDSGTCTIAANNKGRSRSTYVYGREVLTKAVPILDRCWNQQDCQQLKSGVIEADNDYPKVCVCAKSAVQSC
ncbi:uncharacterized protein V1516DRAFT_144445 [Lipomyces oligophaga]|uniref:uncharacterized protein n=1 Tax=Lipomyces oligophaga TaxID=45792 RepID=UPI0034CD3728